MSKNERKTENIVRDELRSNGFYGADTDIQVEEQKSNIETVKRLLKTASKTGGKGAGLPEFIISSPSSPDFLIIVECKADTKDQVSSELAGLLEENSSKEEFDNYTKRVQRFAVDGVLHYSKFLSKEYNVIAIGISGESKKSVRIATYLWPKGSIKPKFLTSKDSASINKFVPWEDYIEHATFDPSVQKLRFNELMNFASELHEFMRDHAKLTESEKPLLVSGTLRGCLKSQGRGKKSSPGIGWTYTHVAPKERCLYPILVT
jgi:type I restriction enzyme M protein